MEAGRKTDGNRTGGSTRRGRSTVTGGGGPDSADDQVSSADDAASADPGRGPSKLLSGSECPRCGGEQAAIRINVDGTTLLMESCDGCDLRRWHLAGERIDLQEALNQVGEHSGRRR